MATYYSLGEAARMLGVPAYKITYSHAVGKLPEPARLLGKRAYRENDLTRLAQHFGVQLSQPASKRPEETKNV